VFDLTGQQIEIINYYLMMAKVMERLAVNRQRSQSFDMERFNLKKLNEVEGKEQFHVFQIGLQLWEIWMQRWKLIVLRKRLEII
jgi:hypothetical protein